MDVTTQRAQMLAAVADFLASGFDRSSSTAYLGARFDAGLARIDWPEGLGGMAFDGILQPELEQALLGGGAPEIWPMRNPIGLGMAAPTLLQFARRDQLERYLRPLWTAEEIWCQLFSEPGSGSDLASVASSAVRDGDDWIVNGQKVWTSLGHLARWGLLLARTDPDVPKHRGLSYFVCDMQAPGMQVRPLRQITGEAEFNEEFLDDVRVPDSERLGEVGEGWKVAGATLRNERVLVAGADPAREEGVIADVLAAWRAGDRPDWQRAEVVDAWVQAETARLLALQLGQLRDESGPGHEGSGLKLVHNRLTQSATSLGLDLGAPDSLRYQDWTMRQTDYGNEPPRDAGYHYLRTRANTIEGGTSEILRNVIAERVLGLPQEARTDITTPWRELPR
jgi:alkylation response protein AidB-like acyl-CoA dehydrogenase